MAECPFARGLCIRTQLPPLALPWRGHAVCRECDRRMSGNGLHRCPTCRTPREGMSSQAAALAAQTAALAQRAREAAAANGGHPTGVQSVLTHAGRNYEVIFFASQAGDARPTDVLEAFAEQLAPGPRTRTAARRRRAIADSVEFGEGPPAGLEAMDPTDFVQRSRRGRGPRRRAREAATARRARQRRVGGRLSRPRRRRRVRAGARAAAARSIEEFLAVRESLGR